MDKLLELISGEIGSMTERQEKKNKQEDMTGHKQTDRQNEVIKIEAE